MANATVRDVMRVAINNLGYKESPAGSNRTKMGKAFGMNGVPWCMEYLWYCGYIAEGNNPFPHSANAAYGQDLIVSQMGGSWVMKKTASNTTKKSGLIKVEFGDCIDFDFGANNLYRRHTAFAIGKSGDSYITIEGNTSATNAGSQSNGGCVAIRYRKYTQVCSNARPAYKKVEKYVPKSQYKGKTPKLPNRGWFGLDKYQRVIHDTGEEVKNLQKAINWATGIDLKVDGDVGNDTLFGIIWFQVQNGLTPDGQFGKRSLAKLNAVIKAHKPTKAQKIGDEAKKLAWAYGTDKAKYKYPSGNSTSAFRKAFDKVFPARKSWDDPQIAKGASCDVFASVVIRASGVDKDFPLARKDQMKYLKTHTGKYKATGISKVADMKHGDIIVYEEKSGGGHICIVVVINGEKYFAEAGYHMKIYGALNRKARNFTPSAYKEFQVYRAK